MLILNRSKLIVIFYLRKSLVLMEKTIDVAPGLYLHQCIRTLEYIFSVFLNYNVDNNNGANVFFHLPVISAEFLRIIVICRDFVNRNIFYSNLIFSKPEKTTLFSCQ